MNNDNIRLYERFFHLARILEPINFETGGRP
jgi:hypothetical protein